MEKTYKCKTCGKDFTIKGQKYNGFFVPNRSPSNTKTCSIDCRKERQRISAREQGERKKKVEVRRSCRLCKKEVISSAYCPRSFCGGKSGDCYRKWLSVNRKGKNNPAYRNGKRTNGKRSYTGKHLSACTKYRTDFLEKNEYLFCEVCGVNENGTPKFEVHHIYFASLYPKHPELHNSKNLILVCIGCHNKFHGSDGRYQDLFKEIESKRGLRELFGNRFETFK